MSAVDEALELVRIGAGGAAERAVRPETIEREGLQGLLLVRGTPAPSAAWDAARRQIGATNLVGWTALARALSTLRAAGVEPVVLPGAALQRLYPDAACRPMDDIDLLTPPARGAEVADALVAVGWQRVPRHPDLFQRDGVQLDLHEDLFHCDRIQARRHAGWLEPAQLWSRRRRLTVEGLDVQVLDAADEVLYTAAHALRHGYRRLTWLVDLALQLQAPELDHRVLAARARASGLQNSLRYGRHLLRRAGCLERHEGSRVGAVTAWWLARTLAARHDSCLGEVLWCAGAPTWSARARLLTEFAFPRTEVLLQVYPNIPRRLAPLAHVLRAGQFVGRGLREAMALTGWRSHVAPSAERVA
jgi:hypothetical protein